MSYRVSYLSKTEKTINGAPALIMVPYFDDGNNIRLVISRDGDTVNLSDYSEKSPAEIDITANYSEFFRYLDEEQGLYFLNNKTGSETAVFLIKAILKLGINKSNDYWESTPGNAGAVLYRLLQWIVNDPGGVWMVE